jgi:hypothetical protein
VACIPAEHPIADASQSRWFSRQLETARQTALNEPAVAARVLSDWMSLDG